MDGLPDGLGLPEVGGGLLTGGLLGGGLVTGGLVVGFGEGEVVVGGVVTGGAGGCGRVPGSAGLIGVTPSAPFGMSGTFHWSPSDGVSGSGRTAPRIGLMPIGETLICAPVCGACTTRPPPMYIATCEASSW